MLGETLHLEDKQTVKRSGPVNLMIGQNRRESVEQTALALMAKDIGIA